MSISRARVQEILTRARDARLAVVGDCMLDLYLTGQVGRISPEAPVPVVQVEAESHAPGGAANVAAGVVALGAGCDLVGVVGDDAEAGQLVRALEDRGVGCDHLVVDPGRRTTTKTRVMARHQHVVRFDRESEADISEAIGERVVARLREVADAVDAIILEDYNKGALITSVIRGAIDVAARNGVPSVADPKFRRFFEYRGVHLFKPNASELSAALGIPAPPREAGELARARDRIGCGHLLITLAEQGMVLLGPGNDLRRIRAAARDVFDVSGAGDTVTAVVATALAAGATEYEAAAIANYAAGVEVSRAGVVAVQPDDVLAALDPDTEERQVP